MKALPSILPLLLLPFLCLGQMAEERVSEAVSPAGEAEIPTAKADPDRAANLVVQRSNEFRQSENLEPLESDPELEETARDFAGFMARTGQYGHRADGQRPSERATEHGYDYCIILENIGYVYRSAGFSTGDLASKLVEGWKESPGHRENMLNPHVVETGVAVVRSDDTGYYYSVQLFGRPSDLSIAFRMINESSSRLRYTVHLGEKSREYALPPRMIRTHELCRPARIQFDWMEEAREVEKETAYVVKGRKGSFRLETRPTAGR